MPHFDVKWNAGVLSGTYTFKVNISKDFDGRVYTLNKDSTSFFGFQGFSMLQNEGNSYVWKMPDDDIHFPYNKYMRNEVISKMDDILLDVLVFYIWIDPGSIGSKFRFTSANLEKGGFFEKATIGTAPPWRRLHRQHRAGYNIDISMELTKGVPLTLENVKEMQNYVSEQSNGKSKCTYETSGTAPHIHCRFNF